MSGLVPHHYYLDIADNEQLATVLEAVQQQLHARATGLDEGIASPIENLITIICAEASIPETEVEGLTELNLALLRTLYFEARTTPELQQAFDYIVISFAYWVCRQGGMINQLDLIVDSLTVDTNRTNDKVRLEALYEATSFIIAASTPLAMMGDHKGSYNEHWQQLIFNYAIIATRSHTPELMDSAYKTLIHYFPEQQQDFFAKAMSEMDRLSYPQYVRSVVERYTNI